MVIEIPQPARERIRGAERLVVFTGAGISASAGLPTMSGPGALSVWQYHMVEDLLSAEKTSARPELQARWFDELLTRVRVASPSAAHQAIARRRDAIVITQNYDGLHQRAGSGAVVELHGAIERARCRQCGARRTDFDNYRALLKERCACGGAWRADLLLYDEAMSAELWLRAEAYARACDTMLVIGSSGQVLPGGLLPAIARKAGAGLIEVNLTVTEISPHCHTTLLGNSDDLVPALLE